jgi:hypothetical protein
LFLTAKYPPSFYLLSSDHWPTTTRKIPGPISTGGSWVAPSKRRATTTAPSDATPLSSTLNSPSTREWETDTTSPLSTPASGTRSFTRPEAALSGGGAHCTLVVSARLHTAHIHLSAPIATLSISRGDKIVWVGWVTAESCRTERHHPHPSGCFLHN